jgi:DNA-binding NarL/FixJ family response regulator
MEELAITGAPRSDSAPQSGAAVPECSAEETLARRTSGHMKVRPGPASILIAEDNYLIAAEMEMVLAQAGFEIAGIAASAEEALALAAAKRPELVLMDVGLGGQRDGIDVAIELFRNHGIRAIFATADHDESVRERAKPASPLAWLPKPYSREALVAVVRRAVHQLQGGTG